MTTHTNHSSQPLDVANPAQNLLLVPLGQLRRSSRNLRKTNTASVADMAASIQRVGLLQNLTVTLASDGEHYEVVAGGRRLAALKLLAKKKRIAKDFEVPCLLVADASARTASLTENVQREAMHPADQFEAFAALVAEGRPVEDIAADFGVTPLVVQRRLKLANVSPRLMADYRNDNVSLEQLMALAITDDHGAQEAAFYDAPHWQRNPNALRERLTEREIDACQHPLARFVGRAAYEQASGGIRRDLFADDAQGVYLTDSALLTTLAQEKLDALAEDVRAEGWAWVEAVPSITASELHAFQRAPKEAREPTAREAKRIGALRAKMQQIGEAIDVAIETGDDERADVLHEKGDALGDALHALEVGLMTYSPGTRALSGAIVTVDRSGEAVIHHGLMREAEAKALHMLATARGTEGSDAADEPEAVATPRPSEALARRLSVHRTAALQVELARKPQIALAALVHTMVRRIVQGYPGTYLPMGVSITLETRLEKHAPDVADTTALHAMAEMQQSITADLPQGDDALLAHLIAMPEGELLRLFALCTAMTLSVAVTPTATNGADALARAIGLDMSAWWTPTADGYFSHVPKSIIVDNVREFAPQHAARLETLKKADMASEAERLATGTGWTPPVFRLHGDTSYPAAA